MLIVRSRSLCPWALTLVVLFASQLVTASPVTNIPDVLLGRCSSPIVRKEWRTLSTKEKKAWTSAVNCLHSKPAQFGDLWKGATTRYEDFIGVHKTHTPTVHFVGQFLPWHRWFTWAFEQALRKECDYRGAQPYWDYTRDSQTAESIYLSPVWDPVTGLGGDGSNDPTAPATFPGGKGGGCIQDGPFNHWTIHMAQGNNTGRLDRCLRRNINPRISLSACQPQNQSLVMAQTNFGSFGRQYELISGPPMSFHGCGHFVVGGSEDDSYTSLSDPMFYLHHANVDRVWATWQAADPIKRLYDINAVRHPYIERYNPPPGPPGNLTLFDTMDIGGLSVRNVTMLEIMDTRNLYLCYTYDSLH